METTRPTAGLSPTGYRRISQKPNRSSPPDNLIIRLLGAAKKDPQHIAVWMAPGERESPLSYGGLLKAVEKLANGLRELGVKKGDRVAVLSDNRPEWAVADFAIMALGAVTVPLYSTLSDRQMSFQLEHSKAKLLFVSDGPHLQALKRILGKGSGLKRRISFERELPDGLHDPDLNWQELLRMGEADPKPLEILAARVFPEDPATIVYTSGTSSQWPKGVLLTHRNFLAQMKALEGILRIRKGDLVLSFLPLAHILQRVVDIKTFLDGGTVAYCADIDKVPEKLLECRPHFLVGVPRTYEKIRDLILETTLHGPTPRKTLSKWIFWWMSSSYSPEEQEIGFPSLMEPFLRWVRKVGTQQIRDRMGGRIRSCFCAGAPLARDLEAFFQAIQTPLYNVYGMTEVGGALAGNGPNGHRPGTVGLPLPGCNVRIRTDEEILVRGDIVSPGYYRPRQRPLRIQDEEGWFPTGDIGRLDPDGFLRITGRKKEILITAAGKNIAPQPIERSLRLNPYVHQAMIVGDGRKYVGALIVPSFHHLDGFAQKNRILFLNRQELLQHPKVHELYAEILARVNKELSRFETIKKFVLLPERFSLEGEELTPTHRMRRSIIERRYRREIESMYRQNP